MLDAISGVNPYISNNQSVNGAAHVWRAQKAAMPEVPVEPVRPIAPVADVGSKSEPVGLGLPQGAAADLAEMNVRQNMRPFEGEQILATSVGGAWWGERAGSTAIPGQLLHLANAQNSAEPAAQGANAADEAARMRLLPNGANAENELAAPADNKADEAGGLNGAQEAAEEGKCQTCEQRKYQDGSDDAGVSFKTPTRIDPGQVASAVRGHEMEHVYREQAKAQREGRKVVNQSVTLHTAICPECGKAYISGGTTRTTTKSADSQPVADTQNQPENDAA